MIERREKNGKKFHISVIVLAVCHIPCFLLLHRTMKHICSILWFISYYLLEIMKMPPKNHMYKSTKIASPINWRKSPLKCRITQTNEYQITNYLLLHSEFFSVGLTMKTSHLQSRPKRNGRRLHPDFRKSSDQMWFFLFLKT